MKIGLLSGDGTKPLKFPNLALMKLSTWHKAQGDQVELLNFFNEYDRVYISKVFGEEYTTLDPTCIRAKEIIYGGTGFAITVEEGKEVYDKQQDSDLPYAVEHSYPDYSLYPELTKNKAFGFLSRGCPRNCSFCLVTEKEGCQSRKVADLAEFWDGQKEIILLDPNILACPDRIDLLQQLKNSKAKVDFTQGLDARLVTEEIALLLAEIKVKRFHFAWDFLESEQQILKGLEIFMKIVKPPRDNCYVYVLTNFNTTIDQDLARVQKIREIGLDPDIRIYRKKTAPPVVKHLARWCNNRTLYRAEPDFMAYIPHVDGLTIKQKYFDGK